MERIEILINKLKEQFEKNADPAVLLGTVQLLQLELNRFRPVAPQGLGTAKVAVLLPATPVQPEPDLPAGYEKYIPRPVAAPPVLEIKETLLVEKDNVATVQKNGQLDMVFDPMKEIPTLSQQPKGGEVNDKADLSESLNDRLKQGQTELMEILKEAPVKDLRKAIGINDRFVFISELFRGDENMYERSIRTINNFNIYAEAEYWISRELKVKLGWDSGTPTVLHFDQLVKRRFS
ncbi:MAG: hypothetical protein HYZ15_05235 [Sphingobacteriales bacterium]|nr:hypothetical protein [Sphingobacteriales bacterium]